jgi:hypothetical protein
MTKQLTCKIKAIDCLNIDTLNTLNYEAKMSYELSLSINWSPYLLLFPHFCYISCIGEHFVCPDVSWDVSVTPRKWRHGRLGELVMHAF